MVCRFDRLNGSLNRLVRVDIALTFFLLAIRRRKIGGRVCLVVIASVVGICPVVLLLMGIVLW